MRLPALCAALLPAAVTQDPPREPRPPALDGHVEVVQDRRHERPESELPTGDWLGVRSFLEEAGIRLEGLATIDASEVLDGGVDEGASAVRHLVDLSVTVDAEELLGLRGGTFFADLQVQDGDDGNADVGDLQVYSNIDADGRSQLAEVWYEQRLDALDGELRVGKIDANGQFALVEHGLRFVNSSMGYSPTILGFPTYPDPAFGASLSGTVAPGASLRAGVFDGALQEGVRTGSQGPSTLFGDPADLFLVAQLDVRWGEAEGRPTRLGLGAWHHTGTFDRFDGGQDGGTEGYYATVDHLLWGAPDGEHVGAFLQIGEADETVSPFRTHLGLGVVWEGMDAGGDDAAGFGVSRVLLSDEPGAGFDDEAETAWELFWSFGLGPWLRVKPDLQLVQDPGGAAGVGDAWVLTLRTALAF